MHGAKPDVWIVAFPLVPAPPIVIPITPLVSVVAALTAVELVIGVLDMVALSVRPTAPQLAMACAKASDDVRLRAAIGDGVFYRDRAQMFALGAIALMLHEQRQEEKR